MMYPYLKREDDNRHELEEELVLLMAREAVTGRMRLAGSRPCRAPVSERPHTAYGGTLVPPTPPPRRQDRQG